MQLDYKHTHSSDVSVLAAEGQARQRSWNEGSGAMIAPQERMHSAPRHAQGSGAFR